MGTCFLASVGFLSGILLVTVGTTEDIGVFIRVGDVSVPLGVDQHFKEAGGELKTPSRLPPSDPHDRKHGAETFCYDYQTAAGLFRLELFDSDFGMHSARLSRVASERSCAPLEAEPTVVVGSSSYSLSGKAMSPPPGFQSDVDGNMTTFEREWVYTDPSRPHMWGTCFSRAVTVEFKQVHDSINSITVMNWEEPGC